MINKDLLQQIINKIEQYDKIAIFRHVFPDADSYSSQVGLKNIINCTFPSKRVLLLGEQANNLSFIGQMDNEEKLDSNTLAIILDVANKERVDNDEFLQCGYVIKIDHHKPFDAPFEDLTWVDTNYTSCSEMILDLYLNFDEKLKIDKIGRSALYTGIIGDTGRFLYLDNPTELYKKISNISYDVEAKHIYSNLYRRSENELKFLGYVYSNFKKTNNGLAYLKVSNHTLKEYGLETMKAVRMVNALQDTEGIINWNFFVENNDGKIYCEFRSNGPVLNDIAAAFGGGGHMLAAGAKLESWEKVDEIIKVFDDNCKNYMKL